MENSSLIGSRNNLLNSKIYVLGKCKCMQLNFQLHFVNHA